VGDAALLRCRERQLAAAGQLLVLRLRLQMVRLAGCQDRLLHRAVRCWCLRRLVQTQLQVQSCLQQHLAVRHAMKVLKRAASRR
jgi:hypothetical protein